MRGQTTGPEPQGEESRAIDSTTGWQISPIMATYLCMRPRRLLTAVQAAKDLALKQSSPSFTARRRLAMRFRGDLRSGEPDKLDQWLREATRCRLPAIHRFARTMSHDLVAVRNASTERWSNGPVEGQINRPNTLKRAMYGRARVELFRARLAPLP
jgi:transposase